MRPIALTTLAATAGLAYANPVLTTDIASFTTNPDRANQSVVIDVSGIEFFDELGSPNNKILSYYAYFGQAHITGISWDLNLTTLGASWASDSSFAINGNHLTPGSGDGYSVTNHNYIGSGSVDFRLHGVDDYLTLEFFETFIDAPGQAEAFFEAGSTITIHGPLLWLFPVTPNPGSLTILGLGMLAGTHRNRP